MMPMENVNAIPLRDGRTLDIEVLTYPVDSARQNALIGLWRTEWTGGDYDWLRSMNGDYSRHLRIQAVLGTIEGRPAGNGLGLFLLPGTGSLGGRIGPDPPRLPPPGSGRSP